MTRLALALLLAGLAAGPADAAVIISIQQTGPDVTATLSGSLNTTGLPSGSGGGGQSYIAPASATIQSMTFVSSGPAYFYPTSGPASWGPGGGTVASSASGDPFVLNGNFTGNTVVALPPGYTSGDPLSATMTFAGATLSSLGLTPGTYAYGFNAGANADTITVYAGVPAPNSAPVPEPATVAVFGGLALAGAAGYRRRKAGVAG